MSYSGIEAEAKANHPRLLKGLGDLKGEFKIKLKPNSTFFALTTPRRVALPLMSKVKAELERMENMRVISKVDIPTTGVQAWLSSPNLIAKLAHV